METAPDIRFSSPRTIAFGIGAMKSGTSWLGKYFKHHPDIHMSFYKELHYWNHVRPPYDAFPRNLRENDREKLDFLRGDRSVKGWLRRLRKRRLARFLPKMADIHTDTAAPYTSYADAMMFGYRGQPVAMEITPAYARLSAETFQEMSALAQDVRFILVMRDPVQRLISNVRHWQRHELGVQNVTAETVERRLLSVLKHDKHGAIDRSRYDVTIERLESVIAPEKICYCFYETLFSQTEMDRLCDFLGVSPRKANFGRMVNTGSDRVESIDRGVKEVVADRLKPTYDFVRKRFSTVPGEWLATEEV